MQLSERDEAFRAVLRRDCSKLTATYGTRFVVMFVGNADDQELVGAFGRAVLEHEVSR